MKTVCQENQCAGCMACVDICPKQAISIQDSLLAYNAVIHQDLCVECDACTKVCQQNTQPAFHAPQAWFEGWASDPTVRSAGSSGGAAGALTYGFLNQGGAVCSCLFENGSFVFRIINTPEDANLVTGSKYIKSNPAGIYKPVKQLLKTGKPVLFIGLPCQSAALQNFVGPQLCKNLYTVDLICHGSPSPAILDAYLQQKNKSRKDMQAPSFRNKGNFQLADRNKTFTQPGTRDPYTLAFLNALIYTENCYNCSYARTERVSDLTIGDSWGATQAAQELQKGISLILCQSEKGQYLLDKAMLQLTDADPAVAVATNHQLHHPSPRPQKREVFFQKLQQGGRFDSLIFRIYPKQSFRQKIKGILLKVTSISK